MKPSRFTEEQIIGICASRRLERRRPRSAASTGSAARPSTKWKAKYGGLEISDARRLKALEDENSKLKKLLVEAMLDNAMLKDGCLKKMVPPAGRREAVAHLRTSFEVSERRACAVLGWIACRSVIAAAGRTTPESLSRAPTARPCRCATAIPTTPPMRDAT
jgi:putative transposase